MVEQLFGYSLAIAFLLGASALIRHRWSFSRWLINDRKEVKDRKKWATRAVEDAQDDLEAIEAEEVEAKKKEAETGE